MRRAGVFVGRTPSVKRIWTGKATTPLPSVVANLRSTKRLNHFGRKSLWFAGVDILQDFSQECVIYAEERLDALTQKQREVLDLLAEHKTSKEIANLLKISPHTVDQRINFSREKLGGSSRRELAVRYRELVNVYEQSLYEKTHIPAPVFVFDRSVTNEAESHLYKLPLDRTNPSAPESGTSEYVSDREIGELQSGVARQLGMAVSMMVGLAIAVAGGLAIFSQLSAIFAS